MSYRSERFQQGFLSLDLIEDGDNPEKRGILSDHGDGARQIRRAAEWKAEQLVDAKREEQLAEAKMRLADAGLERLIPVLDQIVLNGKNRRESILNLAKTWHVPKETARRRYYRGSTDLLTFFSPNEIKGETHVDKS